MTTTAKKRPKQKKPSHAPLAFVGETPCPVCGSEWFSPTIRFVEGAPEAVEESACANLWCPMIRQLRDALTKAWAERRMLAKLAAETPQFDNPLHVFEAQTLRDKVLAAAKVAHV